MLKIMWEKNPRKKQIATHRRPLHLNQDDAVGFFFIVRTNFGPS